MKNDNIIDDKELAFQKSMEILQKGSTQPKLMKPVKQSVKKFDKVLENLKYLLEQTGFKYTLNTERCDLFSEIVSITVIIDYFGVCARDFAIFKEIINLVDDISITPTNDISLEVSFSIHNMYVNALKKK